MRKHILALRGYFMEPTWLLAVLASVILLSVVAQFWLIKTDPRAHPTPERKEPEPALDAQKLIHDLTRHGSAIVRIEVVNLQDVLLRSPRTPQ